MYKIGHILDRYIIRNMLFSYVIIFAIFVGLRIVVDLFTQIDEFTENLIPAQQVAQNILSYYGYHLFQYYQEFSGPIVVFAALFTLFRIRRANETVIILSSGISLYRLLWPVVLVGILLNGLLVVNQELIIPRIADKLVRKQENAGGDKIMLVALQKLFSNMLRNITKYLFLSALILPHYCGIIIYAKKEKRKRIRNIKKRKFIFKKNIKGCITIQTINR